MSDVLDLLLAIALVVLTVSATVGIWHAMTTMREMRAFMARVDERLIPLIEQATTTLDNVDREMERVDGIVTRFEDVSDTVTATTRVASEVVRTPLLKIAGVGGGLRALFTGARRK